MNRREFLQGLSVLSATCMVPKAFANYFPYSAYQGDISPLSVAQSIATQDWTGDRPDFPHDYLWAKHKYDPAIAATPISDVQDVVVVGGGIAGLLATHMISDKKVTLIEMDPFLGGNSKGEVVGKQAFSIGAAYLTIPTEGSDLHNLLADLDLLDAGRIEESTSVYYQNKVHSNFWDGDTDPNRREDFRSFHNHMKRIAQENYPDIMGDNADVKELDKLNFEQWLNHYYPNLHVHIKEYLQLYAWSSFAGSLDEISAAQFIGFIAAETGGVLAFPGGNAAVAQALYQKIAKAQNKQILTQRLVIDVRTEKNYTKVTYVDTAGKMTSIKAAQVIMACPKFVAARLINEMPEDQFKAIDDILYRGYVVANVFVESAQRSPSFEMFCLRGEMPGYPKPGNLHPRPFTDICFGSWANNDPGPYQILTVYKGIALDGARQFLFNPAAHDRYRDMIVKEIQDIFKASGTKGEVKGVRMTRWGHALPLAKPGLMSNGFFETINRPIGDRIFFANQDNWCNPCFEAAAYGAMGALQMAGLYRA
jgi:Protoporphyrinogen oxidase